MNQDKIKQLVGKQEEEFEERFFKINEGGAIWENERDWFNACQAELVEVVREEERERIWVYLEEFLSIGDLLKDDTDLKTISNIIFDKPKIK